MDEQSGATEAPHAGTAIAAAKCLGSVWCQKAIFCKNLCSLHYSREWECEGPKNHPRRCQTAVTGRPFGKCGRKAHRLGLCLRHWRNTPTCHAEKCRRKVVMPTSSSPLSNLTSIQVVYCAKHSHKGKQFPNAAACCSVKNCHLIVSCKNMCRTHYDRLTWAQKRRRSESNNISSSRSRYESTFTSDDDWSENHIISGKWPYYSSQQQQQQQEHAKRMDETECLRYVFQSSLPMAPVQHCSSSPPPALCGVEAMSRRNGHLILEK